MKATEIGYVGESAAVEYLMNKGFKIVERNWKTRFCEIDIVARIKDTVYFVEVKTRASARYGAGIEYITPKKLGQMSFAAEFWVQAHNWSGKYQLSAIGIDGSNIVWIEDIVQ